VEGLDKKYVAKHNLQFNGVNAYLAGDLVGAEAVEGPDAWLLLGEDVELRPGAVLDRPADTASQAAWSAYAIATKGADPVKAEGMSRAALVKEFG
jgi:hypothetical protein